MICVLIRTQSQSAGEGAAQSLQSLIQGKRAVDSDIRHPPLTHLLKRVQQAAPGQPAGPNDQSTWGCMIFFVKL